MVLIGGGMVLRQRRRRIEVVRRLMLLLLRWLEMVLLVLVGMRRGHRCRDGCLTGLMELVHQLQQKRIDALLLVLLLRIGGQRVLCRLLWRLRLCQRRVMRNVEGGDGRGGRRRRR